MQEGLVLQLLVVTSQHMQNKKKHDQKVHKSWYLVAALSVARVDAQLAAQRVGLGQGVVEAVLAVVAKALELQSFVVRQLLVGA